MATKKKATKRKKPSSRPAATKKPKPGKKKVPTKPAKKTSAPKKKPNRAAGKRAAPSRKKAAKTQAAVALPKTFAEKIRDRVPATEVWYRVGDVLSHGVILGSGGRGDIMVVSNGVVSGVAAEDLFGTQADAAAR
jgi:outer membrane biosynthesis protein TonB